MRTIVIFLLAISFIFSSCQQKNYIYIVRHAEKSTEPSGDVYLSQQGRNRAHDLKKRLMHKRIAYIFSTKTNRTRETAQPLSDEIGIPINFYKNDGIGLLAKRCIALKQNILIVGHSNTLLPIIDSFHVTHAKRVVDDSEYNNLFIILLKKGKVVSCKESTYGKP